MLSICRQPIFGALRDQASDMILTGIPEQQSAKLRDRRISDQPESGKNNEVLQMFSLNVDLLTNLPMGPCCGGQTVALTMQRYRIRHRILQLRFFDSALLHPVCEVGFCRGLSVVR